MKDLSKEELLKIIEEQDKKISGLERDFADLQPVKKVPLSKKTRKIYLLQLMK